MSNEWLRDVERIVAPDDGGSMGTGAPRTVWHTTEGSSIAGAVGAYRANNTWPHFTWDPETGRIVQHIPANRAGRALQNRSGGRQTNREGRACLQVEVVGRAASPFTSGKMLGFGRLLEFMDDHGVPRVWPMGQPLAYGPDPRRPGVKTAAYGLDNGQRDPGTWASTGGHYGHSQVPENAHGDPGAIDIALWAEGNDDMLTDTERGLLQGAFDRAAAANSAVDTVRRTDLPNLRTQITDLGAKLDRIAASGSGDTSTGARLSDEDVERIVTRLLARLTLIPTERA